MTIFDVAKYILDSSGKAMPALKLQRLCYYAQAYSLIWNDAPLFEEDFEAWDDGPVCDALYIKTGDKYAITSNDDIGARNSLNEEQKKIIDDVLAFYGDKNLSYLSQLVRSEKPWAEARISGERDLINTPIISKESMARYYCQ